MEGAHKKLESCQTSRQDQRPEGKGIGVQEVACIYFKLETVGITANFKFGMETEELVKEY